MGELAVFDFCIPNALCFINLETGKEGGKGKMEILRTEHLFKKYGKGNNEVIAVNDANI